MTTIPRSTTVHAAAETEHGGVHPWLNAEEAAQLLSVSACTLRRLAKRGEIPCRMVGTRYRFRLEDLRDWPGCAPRAAVARQRNDDASWRSEIAHMDPYRAS